MVGNVIRSVIKTEELRSVKLLSIISGHQSSGNGWDFLENSQQHDKVSKKINHLRPRSQISKTNKQKIIMMK